MHRTTDARAFDGFGSCACMHCSDFIHMVAMRVFEVTCSLATHRGAGPSTTRKPRRNLARLCWAGDGYADLCIEVRVMSGDDCRVRAHVFRRTEETLGS